MGLQRIGLYRQRLEIQSATTERAADGGVIRTWTTSKSIWAKVEPLSTQELMEARRVDSAVTQRVALRKLPTLSSSDRLRFFHDPDRILNIENVLPDDGRSGETVALCSEDT